MAPPMAAILTLVLLNLALPSDTELNKGPPTLTSGMHLHVRLSKLRPSVCKGSNTTVLLFILLMSGDIEMNPGPRNANANIYPCGFCEHPVTWARGGPCCDDCSVWYHKSCLELCSADYELIGRPHVNWLCCKCDTMNISSFTFRSYESDSNYYQPLSQLADTTLESVKSGEFTPLKASSPHHHHRLNSASTGRTESSSGNDKSESNNTPRKRNLRILNMNCRSVLDKKSELTASIDYLKPDIVCGTESWLRGHKPGKNPDINSVHSAEVFPSNYTVYRNDRSSKGGGVFVLVHEDLVSMEQPEFVTDCEIEWVKIKLKGVKDLYVGSFYMPQRNSNTLKELDKSLCALTSLKDKHVVLCGDFNCPNIDWHSLNSNNDATQQELLDIAIAHNLTQTQLTPTRYDNILDLVFTTNASLIKSTTTVPGISDHDIVVIDSDTKPYYNRQKPRRTFMYHKADWEKLHTDCNNISSETSRLVREGSGIEHVWSQFKSSLLNSVKNNIPSKLRRNSNSVPWMNRKLLRMMCKKRKLYQLARRSGSWTKYRQHQRECKKAFRRAEYSFVNNAIQSELANNNSKPFWRYIKSKKQDNIGVSPLKKNGILLSDGESKADLLIDQFASVFTKETNDETPELRKMEHNIGEIVVSVEGVRKLLSSIKVNKASGPDQIPNPVLKECASELAPGIAEIFQLSLKTGTLPRDWLSANITPLFKKGDKHSPENYRPVSLTSVLSKLLEHIVFHHVMEHLERHRVLTHLNHGFRSGFSCETQLTVTMDDLFKNFDRGIQTDVAILDFSKAFDTVPHSKLLKKLDAYGIRGRTLQWIRSFLCDRHMRVIVDGCHSREVPVESGVPQGTVLGPLLFLCHINDLPDAVKSQVRLFADDCLLYRPIRSYNDHVVLQRDLQSLEHWADSWGMRFNASKCYILSIKPKSNYFYQLNKTFLKSVQNNPYLGVHLSSDLKWKTHIDNICKRANSTLGLLRRNLRHSPPTTRKTAYLSLVRSVLDYASVVWDPHLQCDISQLEKIQRKGARFICNNYSREPGCVTGMLNDLELTSLQTRRKYSRITFFYKVIEGLLPAIQPSDYLKQKPKSKRKITRRKFDDYESENCVDSLLCNNTRGFEPVFAKTRQYKNSFFPRTIRDWNVLPEGIVTAPSVEAFKTSLTRLD